MSWDVLPGPRAGCDRVPLAQRADAQSERLSREVRALREERTELLHTASALRSDNDRQAGHIRHIQGTRGRERAGSALRKRGEDKESAPKATVLRAARFQRAAAHASACQSPPKVVPGQIKEFREVALLEERMQCET